MQEKENRYIIELKKFVGQEAVVTDALGKVFKGKVVAWGFNHLNVILMTDKEKIIIKNISNIVRKRGENNEAIDKK